MASLSAFQAEYAGSIPVTCFYERVVQLVDTPERDPVEELNIDEFNYNLG